MTATNAPWNADSDDENDDLDARESWMWGGKKGYVFLIDTTAPMFEKDIDDLSFFATCLEACKKIMLRNVHNQSKDLFGIVLYGTKHTGQTGQPNHVTTLQELALLSADKIKDVIDILEDIDGFEKKHGHSDDFSLADALWHCSKLFCNCTTKLYEKTVFVMTSSDNPHSDPKLQNDVRTRARDLAQIPIFLKLIPFGLTFNGDLFFKEVLHLTHDENEEVCPDIQPMKVVEDILNYIQQGPSKRSVSRVFWTLGNDVKLGVATYNFLKTSVCLPKKVRIERSKNIIVTSRIQAFDSETGAEVAPANISKALVIKEKTIKFEKEELRNVKQITQPGLVLLGFKPNKTIKIWFYRKQALFIYPEERKVKGSRILFAALHEKCLTRKVVAVCYFTRSRSAKPALVALEPMAEVLGKDGTQFSPPGFVLHFLPYSDNIRDLKDYEVKCPDPEPDLIELAERIVDSIKFRYQPSLIDNPKLTKWWAGLDALALGYPEPQETYDFTQPNYESIDGKIEQLSEDFMSLAFPEGFDEDVVKKAVKRTAVPKQPPAKKPKPDLDNSSMENIAQQGLVEKLTVDKLKQYLSEEGVRVGKMKKAELVEVVYRHLNLDQQEN